LRRLEFESEVLARLQHPHIAQVFEAGTHRDAQGHMLPYFVMEYVQGALPITTYAAKNKLGTRERLALFVQACDAVHHGHQKGIIHRDLKPANILVDSPGQAKVIDFGVARATDSDVAVTTMHTDVGSLIGTLQYMSPEQCEADPLGLDIRSDVYSLGVILYELLTGQLPYSVAGRPIPSATRVICESEPTRPSTLDRKLRGDLEIIVLTAMEKDRAKRYQSAGALAADIRLYLQHEPISAKPRSRWTRAVHWAGRHPRLATVGICALIAIGIVGGTAASTWYLSLNPQRVVVEEDCSAAHLVTAVGRRLHTWESGAYGMRAVRELVDVPPQVGAGRLALVGYGGGHEGPLRNTLCAYDVDADRNQPIWRGALQASDLPPILAEERGFKAGEFSPTLIEVEDVFAEEGGEEPGVEIIAVHKHGSVTSSALRIYNLQGDILFQVWADFQVKDLHWLSESRQLVLVGLNGRGFWSDRGHPEVQSVANPYVVFAVGPRLGLRSNEYVGERPGDTPIDPIWYRCIGQASAFEWIGGVRLESPIGSEDARHLVRLWLQIGTEPGPSFDVLVDENGREVDGSRIVSNELVLRKDDFPPLDWFKLQELPPTTRGIAYGSAADRGRSKAQPRNTAP
jgi:hypothetical protein